MKQAGSPCFRSHSGEAMPDRVIKVDISLLVSAEDSILVVVQEGEIKRLGSGSIVFFFTDGFSAILP